jgi:hypothetical protein
MFITDTIDDGLSFRDIGTLLSSDIFWGGIVYRLRRTCLHRYSKFVRLA